MRIDEARQGPADVPTAIGRPGAVTAGISGAPSLSLQHRVADAIAALADFRRPADLWQATPEIVRDALDCTWVAVRTTADEHAVFIESDIRSAASVHQTLPIVNGERWLGDLLIDWALPASPTGGRDAALVLARQVGLAVVRAERRESARRWARHAGAALDSLPEHLCQQTSIDDLIAASLLAARDVATDGPGSADSQRGAAIVRWQPERDRVVVEHSDSEWAKSAVRAVIDQSQHCATPFEDGTTDIRVSIRDQGSRNGAIGAAHATFRFQATPLADSDDVLRRAWLVTIDSDAHPRADDHDEIERTARLIGSVVRAAGRVEQQQYFLDEFAHRVRNNLLTLAQMIDEEKDRTAESAGIARIRGWIGALIGSYGALEDSGFSEIGLRGLVDRIVAVVLGSWSAVEVDLEPIPLNSPQGTVLGIVASELLQNVRKHAYSGGEGRVRVSSQTDGGRRLVVVEDWGAGLPADWRPKGKGVRLMRRLLAGVGGTIQFARRAAPETGTIATVILREPRVIASSRQSRRGDDVS